MKLKIYFEQINESFYVEEGKNEVDIINKAREKWVKDNLPVVVTRYEKVK